MYGKDFTAFCALVCLFSQFIINEFISEVDTMKLDRKVIDALEVSILTFIAQEKILDKIHFPFLLKDQL
jgi:hypothetical protein